MSCQIAESQELPQVFCNLHSAFGNQLFGLIRFT